jgi:hypothetical protein
MTTTTNRELLRIAVHSLFYLAMIIAIMMMWEDGGVFVYENF